MAEIDKAKIVSLWREGMTLAQIRQITAVNPREFDLAAREMKRNGELVAKRKTCADKIVEAYHRGERNPHAIAEQYGVKTRYVYDVLQRNKLHLGKKTRNFVHAGRTNAIIDDLNDGELSQVEIARKHGVSRQYITKIKRKLVKWSEPN